MPAECHQLIDQALDEFERCWSPAGGPTIEQTLVRFGLLADGTAATELIRADIDRRCARGDQVELQDYFLRFPILLERTDLAAQIAFEDYRARESRGLECPRSRWDWIPGVADQSWFARLRSREQYPLPGQGFGDFQLLAVLGSGAFSRVYLARQQLLAGRYVALKVVDRPFREPSHLARLQHTGIVPLYSSHQIGGRWALCMPYMGAATLADWLHRTDQLGSRDGRSLIMTVRASQGRLTLCGDHDESAPDSLTAADRLALRDWEASGSQVLEALQQLDASRFGVWLFSRLAAALAHAHQRGVVHADLKPGNILVRNDGEPALIDFNLSRSLEATSDPCAGGTLPYMSPEQLRSLIGQSDAVGPASDVFSLGVIMYQVSEARLPFPSPASAADTDLALGLTQRRTPRPFSRHSRATPGLRAIIGKCLAFDPAERYATAVELLEDVQRESEQRPLLHARESLLRGRLPKFAGRHPRAFSGASVSVVAVLLLAIVASGWWQWRAHSLGLSATAKLQRFHADSQQAMASLAVAQRESLATELRAMDQSLAQYIEITEGRLREDQDLLHLKSQQRHALTGLLFDQCLVAATHAFDLAVSLGDAPGRAAWLGVAERYLTFCGRVEDRGRTSKMLLVIQARLAELRGDVVRAQQLESASLRLTSGNSLDVLLEAQRLLRQQRVADSLRLLRSITDVPNPAVLFWMTIGRAQSESALLSDAELSFTLAIGEQPRSPAGYLHRGLVYYRQKAYDRADADFSKAIELDGKQSAFRVNRALTRQASGRLDEAIADYDAALALSPSSNRLLLMRSRALREIGKGQAARRDFETALRQQPTAVEDWVARALARLPREKEAALNDLREAERLEPASTLVLQNIAHVQSEHLHQEHEAIETLSRLLDAEPSFEQALAGRAVLYARLGDASRAAADVQVLVSQFSPLIPATRYQIACVHALLGDQLDSGSEKAIHWLAQAVRDGYGADLLDTDPDLEKLRESAAFRTLRAAAKLMEPKKS